MEDTILKRLRIPLLLLLIFSLISLSACSSLSNKKGEPVGNFTYTDENGKPFGMKDLKGKLWVANFIFTSCTTICPQLTYQMSELQKKAKKEGLKDVHFVSFSVDPEVDTPKRLKNYASNFQPDFSTWHLLTGYSQADVEKFALDKFKELVKKPENDTQVVHGTSFYLINKKGEIIKDYSGGKDFQAEEIIKDLKGLD
ncbi:photosynthetic protein synthase I [Heyndrickxia shackletonii]|uniref:Photosynthetic protein synthase I n=1 Tax=Heyndrickxia shackletonii TaxID=157838 RepID=A0A0Q3TP48_9BACI|nr:photosynthetic protein synthase I [Heyndrickxia shackletonii]